MLGTVVGLALAVVYVSTALRGEFAGVGAGQVLLVGFVGAVVALVVGLVLRRTVGFALMFAMLAAVIAAVIEFVQARVGVGVALLGHAVMFWVVSHLLAAGMRSDARRDGDQVGVGGRPGSTPTMAAVAAGRVSAVPGASAPPRPDKAEAERLRDLDVRKRAEGGDEKALSMVWNRDGAPLRDPAHLIEGRVYGIGFDLGIYRGRFLGRRFEGFPDVDDDPEVANWYTFEPAESRLEEIPGTRFKESDFGAARAAVVELPVEQNEARRVFDVLRAKYREWDAQRPHE